MRTSLNVIFIISLIAISLQVKKACFIDTDCIGLTLNQEPIIANEENYIMSSLKVSAPRYLRITASKMSYFILMLLLCGDIETCPGPSVHILPELSSITSSKDLHIFHQNIRGLSSNKDYVTELLEDHPNMDILTMSEIHITEKENTFSMEIPGYSLECKNRTSGKGGGVWVYVSEKLNWTRRSDLENPLLEVLWIEIFPFNAKSFLIGVIYRPPDTSKYLPINFHEVFTQLLNTVTSENKETIILGDVNVNYLDKKSNKVFKCDVELFGFKQLISKPTRTDGASSSLIDIIATNNPETICNTEVIPASIGDHDMIVCTRKLNHLKYAPKVITSRNYNNYDKKSFCEDLASVDWTPVHQVSDVNLAWTYMKQTLLTWFNKHAPKIEKKSER